jgi:signal transduction histidine kinase
MARQKGVAKTTRVSLQRTVDSVLIHDIRNLAFRLSSLLQNMDEHFENPGFRTNMVDTLVDTVRRMNTMVKSFHDHQQKVILKLKLNLNDVLGVLVQSLMPATTRRIRIETDFQEIPAMWGDSYYLQEAFTNLIQNAIDSMPDGGKLSIKTWRMDSRKAPKIAVEVSDTGAGMSPDFIESQLFQPFSTTKENGMGLGLYTTRQVILLHRGTIQLKSSTSEGTTFLIKFPAEENVT